jgi:hypothetical protein
MTESEKARAKAVPCFERRADLTAVHVRTGSDLSLLRQLGDHGLDLARRMGTGCKGPQEISALLAD